MNMSNREHTMVVILDYFGNEWKVPVVSAHLNNEEMTRILVETPSGSHWWIDKEAIINVCKDKSVNQ